MIRCLLFSIFFMSVTISDGFALDRRVRVHNETGYVMVSFFASNTGTNDWQEDILGREILSSGDSVMINIDDGTGYCRYDFKAVFDDGDEVEKYRVNVCEVADFTFTE